MSQLTDQGAHYPPTWQEQVHLLKGTERKLLEYLAEVQRRVSESDESDVASRLASVGSILGYLEESARQLVGLVQAFLRLQEETIRQTRAQTLQQVQDEMYGLLQRLAGQSSSQAAHVGPPEDGRFPPGSGD
jgi:hypothetical protein